MCLKCRVCAAKGRGSDSIPTAIFSQTLPFSNLGFRLFIEFFTFTLIVGYQTIKLRADSNLLGVNWENVGGNGKAKLVDILDCTKLTSINADFDNLSGDYIMAWDLEKGGWDSVTYQYCNIPDYGEDYVNTWLGDEYAITDLEFNCGDAFWLFCKNAIDSISFSGQVANGAVGGATLVEGANLLSNSRPTDLDLTDSTVVEIVGATSINADFDNLSGDYVMAWDSVKGNWNSVTFQYCNIPEYGTEYENVWLGDEYAIGPTEIPAGTGFWYFAKKAGVTITFK